jgi:hypothetical protein
MTRLGLNLFSTFDRQEERMRAHGNKLPLVVYRYYSELSATLSAYVVPDSHKNHPERPRLMLEKGNGFQAVAEPKPHKDITRERFERHFIANRIRDPSSCISTTSSRGMLPSTNTFVTNSDYT